MFSVLVLRKIVIGILMVSFVIVTLGLLWSGNATCSTKISEFGHYCGYSQERFDGISRSSQYIDLASGHRIAIDVLRPSLDGKLSDEAMPVIYLNTVYLRAAKIVDDGEVTSARLFGFKGITRLVLWFRSKFMADGDLLNQAQMRPWLAAMIKHGYIVVLSDAPGTGASFGQLPLNYQGFSSQASQVLDWITAQAWSNGKIGAMGQSYVGMTALATAASGHPSLKAVYASSVGFDPYRDAIFPGGIYNQGFNTGYINLTSDLDALAVKVDADVSGDELRLAQADRKGDTFSLRISKQLANMHYLDSTPPMGSSDWSGLSTYPLFPAINQHQIPVYLEGGWLDIFSRDTLLAYENLSGPRKIRMRPWHHRFLSSNRDDLNAGAETHRWFDYWLKGIENGVMDEAPIHYYLSDGETISKDRWLESQVWPVEEQAAVHYSLSPKQLSKTKLATHGESAQQLLNASNTTTSGINSRWNGVLGSGNYAEQQAQDEKGLIYDTASLEEKLVIAGHPIVTLWLSSEHGEADIFVYLEDVSPDGTSRYISEATVRATHRKNTIPNYKNFGLPFVSHNQNDVKPLPTNTPVQFKVDLRPTAYEFKPGHKIRLSIRGSDLDNFVLPENGPSNFFILTGPDHHSRLSLPVVNGDPS